MRFDQISHEKFGDLSSKTFYLAYHTDKSVNDKKHFDSGQEGSQSFGGNTRPATGGIALPFYDPNGSPVYRENAKKGEIK